MSTSAKLLGIAAAFVIAATALAVYVAVSDPEPAGRRAADVEVPTFPGPKGEDEGTPEPTAGATAEPSDAPSRAAAPSGGPTAGTSDTSGAGTADTSGADNGSTTLRGRTITVEPEPGTFEEGRSCSGDEDDDEDDDEECD